MADEPIPIVASDTEWRRQAGRGGASSISKPLALVVGALMIFGLAGLIVGLISLLGGYKPPYVVTIAIDDYGGTDVAAYAVNDSLELRKALTPDGADENENTENGEKLKTRSQILDKLKTIREGRLLAAWQTAEALTKDRPFILSVAGLGDFVPGKGVVLMTGKDVNDSKADPFVTIEEFLDALAECPAKHKLLLLDITRTRASFDSDRFEDALSEKLAKQLADRETAGTLPCYVLISSSGRGEVSEVIPQEQRSAFSYYLTRGIEGWADHYNDDQKPDDRVQVAELELFVARRANRWATENVRRTQTPKLYKPPGNGNLPLILKLNRKALPEKDAEGNEPVAPNKGPDRSTSILPTAWLKRPPEATPDYDDALIRAENRFRLVGKIDSISFPPSAIGSTPRPVVAGPAAPTLRRFAALKPKPPAPMPGSPPMDDPAEAVKKLLSQALSKKAATVAELASIRSEAVTEIRTVVRKGVPAEYARLAIWEWLLEGLGPDRLPERVRLAVEAMSSVRRADDEPSIEELTAERLHRMLTSKEKDLNTWETPEIWQDYVKLSLQVIDAAGVWLNEGAIGMSAIRNDLDTFKQAWGQLRNPVGTQGTNERLKQLLTDMVTWRANTARQRQLAGLRGSELTLMIGTARACAEYGRPSLADWESLKNADPKEVEKVVERIGRDFRAEAIAALIKEAVDMKSVDDLSNRKFDIDKLDSVLATPLISETDRAKLTTQRDKLARLTHERTWKADLADDRSLVARRPVITEPMKPPIWDVTEKSKRRERVAPIRKSLPSVVVSGVDPNDSAAYDRLMAIVAEKTAAPMP